MNYNTMNYLLAIVSLIALSANGLPATFDIRYQPQVINYANFEASSDPICEAYVWAKQLSQIVSNRVSIDMKQKIVLSGQQLAECVDSQYEKCKIVTLKNIQDGIKYIQSEGLTEEDCYRNKFYQSPKTFCSRSCDDGQTFARRFKAIFGQQSDTEKLLEKIGNNQVLGFAIVKYYDQMNYYSPDKPESMKASEDLYTYVVAQIVGWRKGGDQINLRMGAPGWGFKGYGFVPKNSPLIAKMYSVRMLGYQQFQSE